ncbi:rod shape-determining protein MreD [Hydrogenophaga soli]|nr:rod shape-determining protein MreD [Burkholderiaceae bacterium]
MIMRPGQPLLLPANPVFIWLSLILAMLGNMLINMGGAGRAAWVPDLLALTLVFWNVHQPLRVSVGAAFVFGLAMDVHHTALLGQHALAYSVLSFLAVFIHRRLLWFPVMTQAVHVLPLFALAQLLVVLLRLASGGVFPGWSVVLAPVLTGALWPVASVLLLAPQRRPPDPDKHRPL